MFLFRVARPLIDVDDILSPKLFGRSTSRQRQSMQPESNSWDCH
jgi:hypothetical protein